MLRQTSKAETASSNCSSSIHRVHLITEASSVLPSLSISAFSLNALTANSTNSITPNAREDVLGHSHRFEEGLSSSCKDGLDVFDDPNYTDTVKSNDSTSSFLRRSLSVPPKYTYNGYQKKHVYEVFEDFIVRPEGADENEEDKIWRQTMEDLLERPDYIDSLQSTSSGAALLAKSVKNFKRIESQVKPKDTISERKQECRMYIKNLLILSIGWFFVFGSYLALRNLQSSINSDSSLALYSLSGLYLCFFLGCIVATTVIQFLRPKNAMLIGFSIILLYIVSNFYPTYYTLLPASLLAGFFMASLWTAHSTYLCSIALNYAKAAGKNPSLILAKFNGIFFMFFGVSQVFGNVVSSTVLMTQSRETNPDKVSLVSDFLTNESQTYDAISNSTTKSAIAQLTLAIISNATGVSSSSLQCGISYIRTSAPANSTSSTDNDIDRHVVYILLSIFVVSVLVGMSILSIFLDRLDGEMKRGSKSVGHQLVSVFKWFLDFRAICLTPLMFYSLIQIAFIFGEFSLAFVTCPMGMYMVGYSMMALSICTSVTSYINVKLTKRIGQFPVLCTGSIFKAPQVSQICKCTMI